MAMEVVIGVEVLRGGEQRVLVIDVSFGMAVMGGDCGGSC